MRILVSALLTILTVSPLFAEPLTLEKATHQAETANPAVVASKLEAVASSEHAAGVSSRRFGRVDLSGTYDDYESNRILRPMASDLFADPSQGLLQLPWASNQVHLGLSLQVPLLDAGTIREEARIARLTAASADANASRTREEAWFAVRATYREALSLTHAIRAAEVYADALERDADDAEMRLRVGAWARIDADKVRFALAGAHVELAMLRGRLHATEARLAALMGDERPEEGYRLEETPQEPDRAATPSGTRNDVEAARLMAAAASGRVHQARQAFQPQLVLSALFGEHTAPGLDWYDTREISLIVRVPLFDGGARMAELRGAQRKREAAEMRARARQLEAASQQIDATARCETTAAQLEAGVAQRALGAEVARVEKLKLDQGTGRIEDYLAARASEVRGESAYWQALYAAQNASDYAALAGGRESCHE